MRTARWSQSDILRPRGGSKSRIRYSVDHICFPEPLTWIVTCCLDRRKFVHGGYGRNLPRFRCPATRIFPAAAWHPTDTQLRFSMARILTADDHALVRAGHRPF